LTSDGRLLPRGVLSSDAGTCIDGEDSQKKKKKKKKKRKKKKNRCDVWTEVFLEEEEGEEKWISVDVQRGKAAISCHTTSSVYPCLQQ